MKEDKRIGRKVVSIYGLHGLAEQKRAVWCPGGRYGPTKPMPAAFVLNMQGTVILGRMKQGLYEYIKPERKRSND